MKKVEVVAAVIVNKNQILSVQRQDQDMNSHFTIKTYFSSKVVTEEGLRHDKIILKPNSTNPSYEDIVLTKEDFEENKFNVVGEFVAVLEQ